MPRFCYKHKIFSARTSQIHSPIWLIFGIRALHPMFSVSCFVKIDAAKALPYSPAYIITQWRVVLWAVWQTGRAERLHKFYVLRHGAHCFRFLYCGWGKEVEGDQTEMGELVNCCTVITLTLFDQRTCWLFFRHWNISYEVSRRQYWFLVSEPFHFSLSQQAALWNFIFLLLLHQRCDTVQTGGR